MNRIRVKGLYIVGIVLAVALTGRLLYVQILGHEDLSRAAVSQYIVPIEGLDCRGVIYDRNMIPLTGGTKQYCYIIQEEYFDSNLNYVMSCLNARQIGQKEGMYRVYRTESFDETLNSILTENYNAYAFTSASRYSDKQLAAHLIGYINCDEQKGVAGLELMEEERLSGTDRNLCLYADSKGNILKGIEISVSDSSSSFNNNSTSKSFGLWKANSIVTTLDSKIQGYAEQIMEKRKVNGAVVVLESQTGEIIAAASSPTFNPNNLSEYLEATGDELINKVVQGVYSPGSVFKTVIVAAALKNGVCDSDKTFQCRGKVTVNGVTLECSTGGEEGHGQISMGEALAQSCNCYFAQLGQLVGSERIIDTAIKMGLGRQVLQGFPEECAGILPCYSERIYSGLSNLSIGQGTLGVTPLQVARMTNIIANDGYDMGVHVLDGKSEESRRAWNNSIPQEGHLIIDSRNVLNENVAGSIKSMMESVMTTGTGSSIVTPVSTAGKTGSAEASIGGSNVTHGWFTGYFPADYPQYTVTVFVESGGSGSASALPVFEELVNKLMGDQQSR